MRGEMETDSGTSVRDLRRHQIVSAARELVANGGLHALTFSALESRLAFSRGVITYHFKNKDEIVLALLERAVADIDGATTAEIQAADTYAGKVRAMIAATIRGFLNQPEASAVLVSYWSRILTDPALAEVNARLYRTWRRYAAEILSSRRLEGDPDPEAMAALIVGVVIGLVTQSYFEPGAVDVDAAIETACETILARLGGARSDG